MPVTRILLATDSAKARRSLSDALAGTQEVKIIATASNLMAAYGAAEELIPDVAIVDYSFTKLEEFEMVLALFGVLDIRWVAVGAEDEAQPGPVRFNHNSGLFALECDDRPDLIVSMIRSLSWVARNKSRNRPRQRGGDSSLEELERSEKRVVLSYSAWLFRRGSASPRPGGGKTRPYTDLALE